MKKVLMALFAVALAATVASAGVGIQWTTFNWGEDAAGDGVADGRDVIWQLIYAGADNTIQEIDGSMGMASPGIAANRYVWGDDAVWAEREIRGIPDGGGTAVAVEWNHLGAANPGTVWDEWLSAQSGTVVFEDLAWNTPGSVYQRVFMLEPGYAISHGTPFYQTDLLALDTGYAGGGAPTQGFYVDTQAGPFVIDGSRTVQMIPEPATMSLLGLGALVMAIRRRRS